MESKSLVFNVRSCAAALGVTEKSIRNRIARQQLPFRKLGGRLVIPKAELEAYLAGLAGVSADQAIENSQRASDSR